MKKTTFILASPVLLVIIPVVFLAVTHRPLVVPAKSSVEVELVNKLSLLARIISTTEDGKSITVKTEQYTAVFSKDKNIDLQINTLQELLKTFRMDGGNRSVIDLRFDKAVIRPL